LAVLGNLELLRSRTTEPGMLRLIDAADRGVDRGQRMVSDLLAFARKQPLVPQIVDVNSVVAGLEDPLRAMLPRSATLQLNLGPRVPRVFVDQAQLERALLNLVSNARDALAAGEGTITIETEADGRMLSAARNGSVRVAVRDTGTGMDPEARQRAFEPFFTTKPAGSGTGLGLSQVYGFVRQSNGEIAIDSKEGEGTMITILLTEAPETA
jgi:signal transduction histidine kinase